MRRWSFRRKETLDGPWLYQSVDVLGWTQHGAVVIANEPGWVSEDEPSFVSMFNLVLRERDGA